MYQTWKIKKLATELGSGISAELSATSHVFPLKSGSRFCIETWASTNRRGKLYRAGINLSLEELRSCESLGLEITCRVESSYGSWNDRMTGRHLFTREDPLYKFGALPDSVYNIYKFAYETDDQIYIRFTFVHMEALEYKLPDIPYNTISNRLWRAYNDGVDSTLTIRAHGKDFKVHRLIFEMQSAFFKQALSTDAFVEGQTGVITLDTFELSVLEALVRWMYTGEIPNPHGVESLYRAADFCQISDLKQQCVSVMFKDMTTANVTERLVLAIFYDDFDFRDHILKFIAVKKELENFTVRNVCAWTKFKEEHGDLATKFIKEFGHRL